MCVALAATVVAVLGMAQPSRAQEPSPPAEQAAADTPPAASTPPPAPEPQPEPAPPETTPAEPTASADSAPPAGSSDPTAGSPSTQTPADATASKTPPAATEPEAAPENVVKLEDEPKSEAPAATAAPEAPAPAPAEAPAAPASAPVSEQSTVTIVLVEAAPATDAATASADPTVAVTVDQHAGAEGDDKALAVSFAPSHADDAVASLAAVDQDALAAKQIAARAAAPAKAFVQPTCARPKARVPLSQRCKQVRAAAVLGVTLLNVPSPEVRAAIERGAARIARSVAAQRMDARASPGSKAAKKPPVTNARPTLPFQGGGPGATNDSSGSGSSGSASSSRLFAVTATPLRIPMPFRHARLRLPRTILQGVLATPPTARPG